MAYDLSAVLTLGAANAGLTLSASLFDAAGDAAAGLTTTTLEEIAAGTGAYVWAGTVPDGHRGFIRFDSAGTFKTAVSVNGQEVEFPDIKTSTVAGLTATAVWAAGTRTLTSFGTLAADTATAVWAAGTRTLTGFGTLVADVAAAVWSAATRTLTSSGGITAADVWTYATRTLTQAITAVDPPPVITGDTITFRRGDTVTLPFTGLGSLAGRTKLWFTIKLTSTDTDAEAIVQIEETAGLVRLNGAAGTAGNGSIVVTDANAGDITVTLAAAAGAAIQPSSRYEYDVQKLTGTAVTTLTSGEATVLADVTSSVA